MSDSHSCHLCGSRATPTLRDRPDYEYAVRVVLDYWRCTDCGLVFADPIPSGIVSSFYAAYSTHERTDPQARNGAWTLIEAAVPRCDNAGAFASLDIPKSARILDFGCGAGQLLDQLRHDGFTDLAGCDFDPKVAATALPDLRFFAGIGDLSDETFDVITMNHVIEHVEDIPDTLARLRMHLAPEGYIYIRTPNAGSTLANTFGDNWRGWETPRHLNILTPEAMRRAVAKAGGNLALLATSNDMRAGMLIGSVDIALHRLPRKARTLAGVAAYVPGAWWLKVRRDLSPLAGEEIVAIVR